MYAFKNIYIVQHDKDLLVNVSKNLIDQFKHYLPDLHRITLFLPNMLTQALLREHILNEADKYGFSTIMPPQITTLRQWSYKKHPNRKPILSQYARELILVDAIKQQAELFSSANPWGIANELLSLFDAMNLNDVNPIDFNNYYQNYNPEFSHALLHESDLVKVLWNAWCEQIIDEQYLDPIEAYANALKNISTCKDEIFYCVGLNQLTKLECNLLGRIEENSEMFFYCYGSSKNLNSRADQWLKKNITDTSTIAEINNVEVNPISKFLDKVFEINSASIKQRAEEFSINYPNIIPNTRIKTYKSNNFEHHAQAIDIQIRLWFHENLNNIGIVTTDRKLVRRLRAILEHANIVVDDSAGWALATTSAAVVIEWWLQLIEEQYPAKQLISLANSPFFSTSDPDLHRQAINFFEKEIILKFNIHSGINRYRNAIENFKEKPNSPEVVDEKIISYLLELLDKFENSSQLLAKLHNYTNYSLSTFMTELLNSLKPIGLYTRLNDDLAGKQIIELFTNQISHFRLIESRIDWSEFRRFISRIFDQQNFKPPTIDLQALHRVTFCSLEQSRLQNFDALVIASVDKNNFPGTVNNYIFFNEQVRSELNIPTWRDEHDQNLHLFRCLLDASKNILITVQNERDGEKTTPCPWLEAIETFYYMAYGHALNDPLLESLVGQNNSKILPELEIPLQEPISQPRPVIKTEISPTKISISQYQRLLDCPYQYFALTCLKLSPTDELQEDLNKADFGILVHRCIHAFFSDIPTLPGPFSEKITQHNRDQAENVLKDISRNVFLSEENNHGDNKFNKQLWFEKWLSLIPRFIDWEIKRQLTYTPYLHETTTELNINNAKVYGRLDRIDQYNDSFAIVDYKTGQTPSKVSILAGEQVQLPVYALLNDANESTTTEQVEYVSIGDKNTVRTVATLKADELNELKQQHLARLRAFFDNLNQDIPFTALANDETCQRCDAFGICRKSFWKN